LEIILIGSNKSGTSSSGPWALTRTILREEGPRGMFRGLVPTFAREMPGYFFFFGGYEFSRSLMTPEGKTKDEIGQWLFCSQNNILFWLVTVLPPSW
jgi:solute carrier family 25 (mitochondrial ornithine transporter) member 2/15